ncbi:MAG: hypothetical protein K2F53_04200 [Rikenellaceae bacterium]|nr:hypothetical protein [Rikenellaceae bacterium]MDE7355261.1 hypothetical protein [Rikenellaceae bacterium]
MKKTIDFDFDFSQFADLVNFLCPSIKQITEFYATSPIHTDYKADLSPVTIVDRSIEQMFTEHITTSMPQCAILGEESGLSGRRDSRYRWIIDPIDGTNSYIHGVPLYSTLIAFTVDRRPLYGAIYLPALNKLLIGNNEQTFLDGKPVSMRPCESIEKATLLTSGLGGFFKHRDANRFIELARRAKCFRTWGDGYGYYLLATGRADIMVDAHVSLWDCAAIVPIIRGAGGIITDYHGNDVIGSDSMVAACPELHPHLLNALTTPSESL